MVRRTFSASPVKVIFMTSAFSVHFSSSRITQMLHVNLEARPTTKVAKQLPPAFPIETSSWLYPFTGSKTLRSQILWEDGPFSMESINVVKSNHMHYRYTNKVNNLRTAHFVMVYCVVKEGLQNIFYFIWCNFYFSVYIYIYIKHSTIFF